MRKSIIDDGSYPYLTKGANLVGKPGIPELLDLKNVQIPKSLIPFSKIKDKKESKRQYVHFYEYDYRFQKVLTSTKEYVDLLKQFDGVLTPDCSMLVGQAPCIQQTNTYFNRAVGFYLQRQGIPVIPNVRWSDENSFEYCFLGIPPKSIVAVSNYGCFQSNVEKEDFIAGLREMINILSPTDVIVHGSINHPFFKECRTTHFHHYISRNEQKHSKGIENGKRV